MTKIIGVLQARMGSSRVPGKAMVEFAGRPLIWHMIDRLRRVNGVGPIVLATTADPANEPLIQFCRAEGLVAFQYPEEDDLAGRISDAIKDLPGDIVLKVGGDCPLIDPAVLQKMVDAALADPAADFVSNRVQWSYPLGLSADVVSRRAVEWCDANLSAPEDRELFALYIRDHPDRFKVVPVVHDTDLTHHNWCVDTREDYDFVAKIFAALYKPGACFGLAEVLDFLDRKDDPAA